MGRTARRCPGRHGVYGHVLNEGARATWLKRSWRAEWLPCWSLKNFALNLPQGPDCAFLFKTVVLRMLHLRVPWSLFYRTGQKQAPEPTGGAADRRGSRAPAEVRWCQAAHHAIRAEGQVLGTTHKFDPAMSRANGVALLSSPLAGSLLPGQRCSCQFSAATFRRRHSLANKLSNLTTSRRGAAKQHRPIGIHW